MADEEQLQLLSTDERADCERRLAIFRANNIQGTESHSDNDLIAVGKGNSTVYLYKGSDGYPTVITFDGFSSRSFWGHYAAYQVLLELGRITCAGFDNPDMYTSAACRATAMQVLEHLDTTFCIEDSSSELEGALRRALQTKKNDAYGSFFESVKRANGKCPELCMVHGSCMTHATSTCRTLAQLRDKYPGWDPSKDHQLCIALWEISICNPQWLHRQAEIRDEQWQQRQQAKAQAQPQQAAAASATPGKRAGEPLINRPGSRLRLTANGFATAAAAAAAVPATPTSSIHVAVAAPAAPATAAAAPTPEASLLGHMVMHTTAQHSRSEEKYMMLADSIAQVAALTTLRDQQEQQIRQLKAELSCYRKHCSCKARREADAVRDDF
ncbi:hypothetical protein COO60DRAFT_1642847 [Scenedesmus sp. NREL 46B-D3]|nr:hypothetical protein COO60DRAFT_1642847 [Scenedesmus sp. NREL 46B-D3]